MEYKLCSVLGCTSTEHNGIMHACDPELNYICDSNNRNVNAAYLI